MNLQFKIPSQTNPRKQRHVTHQRCCQQCFSHSTASELYYEVHITRILRTARISNVDGVMFADRKIREMVGFELSKEKKKDVFRLVTSMGQRKNYE